jgi:EpsI family protein
MLFQPRRMGVVRLVVAMAIMLGSVAVAEYIKPTTYWADHTGEPRYDQIIPAKFSQWVALPFEPANVIDPVQEASLKRIYSQTFNRTFVHQPTGRVIMLSIAYGRDQSNDTQLHTPEQCYPSQGFKVESREDTTVSTPWGDIKAVHVDTRLGAQRAEPLTYFIRVGNDVARGSKERNLERIRMAMKGFLVDGTLVRVSEISTDAQGSYRLQHQFLQELLSSLTPDQRAYLIGRRSI